MSSHPQHNDKGAGFTGLIVGAICVGAILFSVVKVTNARYNNEKGAEAHAEATK